MPAGATRNERAYYIYLRRKERRIIASVSYAVAERLNTENFRIRSENSATVKVGKTLCQEYIFAYFLYKQKVSRQRLHRSRGETYT